MKTRFFIGLTICGLAGGLAYYFGGFGAVAAVAIGESGVTLMNLSR